MEVEEIEGSCSIEEIIQALGVYFYTIVLKD